MQKDFDTWNKEKKIINTREDTSQIFFKEHEIWWSSLGLNVSYEQDGKGQGFLRPVLVLKTFNPDTFYEVISFLVRAWMKCFVKPISRN